MKNYDNNWFIDKAKKIHGDKYDYSLVNYINLRTKVKIICPIHGEFEQKPEKHLMKRGCQKCDLPFDFFLPDYNMCIEFDGEQHFKPKLNFGGMIGFIKIQTNDNIKNEYCNNNNIKLLRIKYNEDVIDKLKNNII